MIRKFLLFLLVFMAGCSVLKVDNIQKVPSRTEQVRSEFENASIKKVLVVSHRANWKKAPENSKLAVLYAINMGVDIIEIDIRKTKDGKFILMHDYTVNRTTDGKGKVKDLTVKELRELRLKGPDGKLTDERIPTLSEILLLCKDKILINLDKAEPYIKELLPILEETKTSKQIILKGGLKSKEVSELLGDDNNVIYMPIVHINKIGKKLENQNKKVEINKIYPLGKNVRALELVFKQLNNPALSKPIMQKLKNNNVRTWVNTIQVCHPLGYSDKEARKDPDKVWGGLIKKGFSIIQTDEPKALLEYLKMKKLHE